MQNETLWRTEVAPRAWKAGSYCSGKQESQLWWRGQVFTSSRALSLSLSDPAPAHTTTPPELPPASTQFNSSCFHSCCPHLTDCCCCFQVWIRRSQITLVHPPPPLSYYSPLASLSRSASVYKAPSTMRPLICSWNEVGTSSWD